MPLYELVCIAKHHANLAPLHTLLRSTTSLVHQNHGVVRTVDHWGTRNLPSRMRVGKRRGGGGGGGEGGSGEWVGDYFSLTFDCSPPTLAALNSRLRLDPSVLRWTTLKLGSTLDAVTRAREETGVRYSRVLPEVEGQAGAEERV
ncbi:hypothetical protein JCM8097_005104 [Rhodosporidiobolus ruineniae]